MTEQTQLIHRKEASAGRTVSVWREEDTERGGQHALFRKVWQCSQIDQADAWLSWARHEHLLLTLLAGRGAQHSVEVSDLHVRGDKIELVTRDAGPELQRDWLAVYGTQFANESTLLQLAWHVLNALQEIHALGIVHGDLKSDNLCIPRRVDAQHAPDWPQLRLIDFAFSLSSDNPLRFVLPIDPERIDYLPDFYRQAIRRAQSTQQPGLIQRACHAEVDLYSLGIMLQKTARQLGLHEVPRLTQVVTRCLQIGAHPPTRLQRWLRSDFSQPTREVQALVRKLLDSEVAETPLAENAATRPHSPAPQTPLGSTASPTPLVTPLAPGPTPLAPRPQVSPEHIDATPPAPQAPTTGMVWNRVRWLLVTLALAVAFWQIDRLYVQAGLLINDLGYRLGLGAFVLGPLLGIGAAAQGIRPYRKLDLVLLLITFSLMGIAFYFAFALSTDVVPKPIRTT